LLWSAVHSAATTLRSAVAPVKLPESWQVRAILLDIEGTTTPLEFVYFVLFPYAARELNDFIRVHFDDPEIRSFLESLRQQRGSDASLGLAAPTWHGDSEEAVISSLTEYGRWLMKQDRKDSALKSLQGLIWKEGYARGELRGQVYPEVPKALQRWREQGKATYIYSSGSVLAQKLLFQSTEYGDLTLLLDGFFDTQVGAKADPNSYRKISAGIRCEPQEVLFLSDAIRELEAAESAGMHTGLSIRPGNKTSEPARFAVIHSFDEIFPS
jgi:enolase-phosphatase E1